METVLKVSDLSITLSDGREIVKGVSFEIKRGEVVALVGENGCGKSTVLKAIMREDEAHKSISGSISYLDGKNLLEMNERELQAFRARIAYVSQRDEYANMGKRITALDVMMDSAELYSARKLTREDVVRLFDRYKLRSYDESTGKPLFHERSHPAKLSGGQQRLLSIISAVAVRKDARLFIIDEPLNNLDFKNARRISDLITRIHKENPDAAILMVTHCRIFPCITRLITMDRGRIIPTEEEYRCHNCFGKPNADGYYE
jgi:ABC-type glutathione transport system ATPase component